MMCERVGSEVLLDFVQGRLTPESASTIQAHLAECDDCRRAAAGLRSIAILADEPAAEPSPESDQAVRDAIARLTRPAKPATRRLRFRRLAAAAGSPSAALFWGVAATLLFVLAVGFALRTGPRPAPTARPKPAAPEPVHQEAAAPPPAPVPKVPTPPVPQDLPAPERRGVRAPAPDTRPEPPPPAPVPPETPKPAVKDTVVAAPAEPVEFGRVVQLTARAERGGKAIAKGDRLFAGDAVAVGTGTLLVETWERSLVALRSGATCTLARDADHVVLRLAEGEVACSVRKDAARRFSVETAHGTATVKGTIFSVRTTGASASLTVSRGRVEARNEAGAQDVPAGARSTMARGSAPSKPQSLNADRALSWAFDAGVRLLGPVWIASGEPGAEFQAPMTRGRLFADEALAGEPAFAAVDSRTLPSWTGRFLRPNGTEGGSVAYTVEIPEAGEWYLWGRLYYPGTGTQLWRQEGDVKENDPNSFYVSVDGKPEKVLGNLKVDPETRTSWYRRWHWGGDGAVEVGKAQPLALGALSKGRHTIRLRARDAVETSALHLSPRLDLLCLTPDRDYRPRDEDYRR